MAVAHFSITFDTQGSDAPTQEEVSAALAAAFPAAGRRVREGFPNVVVVVPPDPDEEVIFATNGRLGVLLLDARNDVGAEALARSRDRIAANEFVEVGSTTEIYDNNRIHAIRMLDGMIEECAPNRIAG